MKRLFRESVSVDAEGCAPVVDLEERISGLKLCVIVPVFNNAGTLAAVINDVLRHTSHLIVVDDGSTDDTGRILKTCYSSSLYTITCKTNKGKGYALKCGFDRAEKLGYRYAISMDADGQHRASDIVAFVDIIEKTPDVFIAGRRITEGEMPAGNSFANRLSNFWVNVLTWNRLYDTQNGFRLYPLCKMEGMRSVFNRYEAEVELLVRCAWKGIKILPAATHVYYPPKEERVTHYRPVTDFLRITGVNALFVLLAVVYGYPSLLYHRCIKKRP
ncbi:MAG: glycosyltransferase family 2 protein [Tannerella sp.]|nr:glycosyltransferase family 2 protein [Tannerella sp.]